MDSKARVRIRVRESVIVFIFLVCCTKATLQETCPGYSECYWNGYGELDIGGVVVDELNKGYTTALSFNGKVVAVGAPQITGVGVESATDFCCSGLSEYHGQAGQGRIYEYDDSLGWIQRGPAIEGNFSNGLGDNLGVAISLSWDGSVVAIAGKFTDGNNLTSHVDVYEWISSAWVQRGDRFNMLKMSIYEVPSISLSADGSVLAMGESPTVYIYSWNVSSGSWRQLGGELYYGNFITGPFSRIDIGKGLSLSADGTVVAIDDGSNKTVRVYNLNSSESWNQQGADINFGSVDSEYYGSSVALSSDGKVIAVGALEYNSGSDRLITQPGFTRVYEWNAPTASWNPLGAKIIEPGVPQKRKGFLETLQEFSPYRHTQFMGYGAGMSTSLSFDGNVVTLANPYGAYVYAWDNSTSSWISIACPFAVLVPLDVDKWYYPAFQVGKSPTSSVSIALSPNGKTVALGIGPGHEHIGTTSGVIGATYGVVRNFPAVVRMFELVHSESASAKALSFCDDKHVILDPWMFRAFILSALTILGGLAEQGRRQRLKLDVFAHKKAQWQKSWLRAATSFRNYIEGEWKANFEDPHKDEQEVIVAGLKNLLNGPVSVIAEIWEMSLNHAARNEGGNLQDWADTVSEFLRSSLLKPQESIESWIELICERMEESNILSKEYRYGIFLSHQGYKTDKHGNLDSRNKVIMGQAVSSYRDLLKFSGGEPVPIFFDKYNLGAGDSQIETMLFSVCASDKVMVFVDKEYFSRKWCLMEYFLAKSRKGVLMPFKFDNPSVPGSLLEGITYTDVNDGSEMTKGIIVNKLERHFASRRREDYTDFDNLVP